MKRLLIMSLVAFFIVYSLSAFAQRNPSPLTNEDIVKMLRIRLPESAILGAINSSPAQYDLTERGRKRLRQKGATDAILRALEKKSTAATAVEEVKSIKAGRTAPTNIESSSMAAQTLEADLALNVADSFASASNLAAFVSPVRCTTSMANSMSKCHANYPGGCNYSQHPGYDAYLNSLKNLLISPGSQAVGSTLTRNDFLTLEASTLPLGLTGFNHASKRQALSGLGEGKIRKFMGVLYYGFPSDEGRGEACNCMLTSSDAVDFHIGVGFGPIPVSQAILNQLRNGADVRDQQFDSVRPRLEQTSAVVEITPHYRAQLKPAWTLQRLQHSIGRQVLVLGQLLADNAHFNASDNCSFPNHSSKCWRFSGWEIHPVTAFYVCTSTSPCSPDSQSGWTRLENLQ